MALYKHTTSLQTKRLVEWFRDTNGNHKVRVTINGRYTEFLFDAICNANRQYEKLAAM